MKPRVILYNPRSNASGKKILPMSLLALGAVLENKYDYSIVDGNCESDPAAAIREQVQAGANLLAVTVMPGPQLSQAVPHCRALKNEFPHLAIVGWILSDSTCRRLPEIALRGSRRAWTWRVGVF